MSLRPALTNRQAAGAPRIGRIPSQENPMPIGGAGQRAMPPETSIRWAFTHR
jgi:hypothetical protein